jgi:hypothetical protein
VLARGGFLNILSTARVGDVRAAVNMDRTVVGLVGFDSSIGSAFWACGTTGMERPRDAKTMAALGGVWNRRKEEWIRRSRNLRG